MAAPPRPRALLRGTTQMSLNERFTTLLKNTGPRPGARHLGRRARHVDYRPRFREAGQLGKAHHAQLWRAPSGSPEGALAGAAIGGARDLLFIHRDSALEGARGASAPRTVLKGRMSPRAQDLLPARRLASAPHRNFRRAAHPARGGPHRGLRSPAQRLDGKGPQPRARFGAQAQGRVPGQGRSPLNRPPLTKEQLDAELDAYMALARANERLDADLQANTAQPATPVEGLDADLDAYMAPALPHEEGLDSDLDAYMADADPDTPTNTDP